MSMPPAGWYPSPEDPNTKRYWDGAQWLNIPAPEQAAAKQRKRLSKRSTIIISIVAAVVVLGVAGGVIAKGVADDKEAARVALVAEMAQERKDKREAAAAEREAEKVAAQKEYERAKRAARQLNVAEIEAAVKTMAEGHVTDGTLTGPIISVSCSPVGGGSTDDLDQNTTVFECFAANVDNGDGTMNGYKYNATMNWATGSYTYGLGAP